MAPATLTGKLLVATPLLGDPTFERTVVLLLAHGVDGAFGLVINRPSATAAAELVPGWGERASQPAVLFIGGPVGTDAVIGLHPEGTVDLNAEPSPTAAPSELRLFAGSAGWGPGQLEGEIGDQAWWVVESEPDDAFSSDPSNLWSAVLRRQPSPTSWFATFPTDPEVN